VSVATAAVAALLGSGAGALMGGLGGGGGVVAVPLLVQVLDVDVVLASTASLVFVLLGSLLGLVPHARAGSVRWRPGLLVGALSTAGALSGSLAAPRVPDRAVLVAFVVLLVVAAASSLRPRRPRRPQRRGSTDDAGEGAERRWPLPGLAVASLGLGAVVGLLGVGGGFLVVPLLVAGLGLRQHAAVGTALVVLPISAAAGLLPRLPLLADVPASAWVFVLGGVVGAALGALASPHLPAAALRRGFAVLLLAVAVWTAVEALP